MISHTATAALLTFGLATAAPAQQPTPAPKKDPFAGFGQTGLDRKPPAKPAPDPAGPPAGNVATKDPAPGGLKLNERWDTPSPLMPHAPLIQRQELHALLDGFVEPSRDTGPHPTARIYGKVTYLKPVAEVVATLGLAGAMQSGGQPPTAGFPSGLSFSAISAGADRKFETRLILDRANQVAAVEFVAPNGALLPPRPDPLPTDPLKIHRRAGECYDYVPQGTSVRGHRFPQEAYDFDDYILVSTRGGPKAADLYLPKPFAGIVLYCLDLK